MLNVTAYPGLIPETRAGPLDSGLRESLTTAVVGYKSGGSSIFTGVVSVSGLRIEKPLFNGI
jgi:hypothetical protein